DVAMLQLLPPECLQFRTQRCLVLAQAADLVGIVFVDRFFDGYGACHCGPFAKQRSCGAESKARNVPDRLQCRGPDAPLDDVPFERFSVATLLLGHVAQHRSMPATPEHRELALIDPDGAIFPGMIDTND